ncbi:alpha/beta hydrolase [Agrobacterium rosae]|uniref:Alpha/beta hydrolase n=1 Tax=Agrobacterium rosae TaxID=1972867 RepID=A0AAE5VQV3_9HYPH|nr:alpha/beta hydrolase [Agrobacterium rosae]KAA3512887.1 alpha/beta hydrolase [Agrobacterium rosae]KAA3521625.1 alpha/beta hydrolase [Agrobacterium rosae]MCM2432488.1 alpha/beta hydrolase [Agrobacterium rosae]MDX8328441.1 alpha/beta hydrolase [Agrobacterium rosae]MQB48558.1 alpha/beta hydrolase [Agrobacterium rosae]
MMTIQPLLAVDAPVVAAMRKAASAHKGETLGPEARPMFDAMLAATPAAANVRVETATVGGIAGFWLRVPNARPGARILYLHGGGYVLGSAQAFGSFVGQIAARVGTDVFVPNYRLAPEHPFPAAIDDAVAAYRGLAAEGAERIVVVGDSAGGGLTLALLSILATDKNIGKVQPVGAAVMSPWTDLALTGESFETRAEADPIFTRGVLKAFSDMYLQGQDATNPKASPLYAQLNDLPPVRIDVGDDEVLLSDSIRYAERAQAAGVEIRLSVWEGMPHVFQSSISQFRAAELSVNAIGDFLRQRLDAVADVTVPSNSLKGA